MTKAPSQRGNVLLDLDGTLSDPKNGIIAAYRYAVEQAGRPSPPEDDLLWIIGPPLRGVLLKHLGDEVLALRALEHYRDQYGTRGLYESVPYPGALDAVRALHADGYTLFLATSKLVDFARLILDHFGITGLFTGLYGSQRDGSLDQKTDLIAHLLHSENLDPSSCVMVGDRKHDVIGALANKVPCIGAAWGYGGADELQSAGVSALCASPAELPAAIRRILSSAKAA